MRIILIILSVQIACVFIAGAVSLMILDKPWWTWTVLLLLAFGAIPKVRL